MRTIGIITLAVAVLGLGTVAKGEENVKSIYDFSMQDINGKPVSLSEYKGQVLLIVNVASKCGFTGQYAGLEKLYEGNKDRGLVLLGFPANDFGSQEPGTDAEIQTFCSTKYGVTFPMFSKITVKGEGKHPLYKFLTEDQADTNLQGEISWNFNKFLVGKDGTVLARYGSRTKPEDEELTSAIDQALAK